MKCFDMVIIGGSLVGLSLARAVAGLSLKVAVIEPRALHAKEGEAQDSRAIALSYGSRTFFNELGIWDRLSTHSCPIEQIHCSEKGHCGQTRFEAEKEGLQALGYVIPFADLHRGLYRSIAQQDNLTFFSPATLHAIMDEEERSVRGLQIKTKEGEQTLETRLLVGADGARSCLRRCLGIEAWHEAYPQAAIIADVQSSVPHRNRAYERFSSDGPMALLPLKNGLCALVYTMPQAQLNAVLALSDADFLAAIQQRFGYRLGHFKWVSSRQGFPLSMHRTDQLISERAILMGNAAHALHPVAGQGFNLGLRDVATLARLLMQVNEEDGDPGEERVLQRYKQLRQRDQHITRYFTDGLVRLFVYDFMPLALGRNAAMNIMNVCPPLKSTLTRMATGLSQRPSIEAGFSQ